MRQMGNAVGTELIDARGIQNECRFLAVCVIDRALGDIRGVFTGEGLRGDKGLRARADAVSFCLGLSRGWWASLQSWCDMAEIQPHVVMDKAMELAGGDAGAKAILAAAPDVMRKVGRPKVEKVKTYIPRYSKWSDERNAILERD